MPFPNWLFPRFRSFWFGLTLPLAAGRLIISKKALVVLSIIPIVVTIGLYTYLISFMQSVMREFILSYLASFGFGADGWMVWWALLLSKLLLLLIGAFTFSFVAGAASSPFNDFLAESAEKWAEPPIPPAGAMAIGGKLRLIAIDLLKTLAASIATIVALLLSWVPIINFFAFGFVFLLIAFQYLSYPQTRRGQGLGECAKFLWRHLYSCLGFGMAISALFALPLISVIALPLAVVGGTLLFGRAQAIKPLTVLK